MKAIILAAGEGKRLRPLTNGTPKSLVKIWGQSLLERQLAQLTKFGIDDITVVTGYCKEKIEQLSVHSVFNPQYDSTNMVFSLSQILPDLNTIDAQEVLILYGDIGYCDAHLASLIESQSHSVMTVLGNTDWYDLWSSRLADPLSDAETFLFDDDNKLLEIGKKPTSLAQVQAQYMGMIKVNTQFLIDLLSDYINCAMDNKVRNMYLTDLVQQVVESDSVHVELVAGRWIEVDTIDDYNLYAGKTASDFGLS